MRARRTLGEFLVSGLTRSFDLSISLKAVSQSNGELPSINSGPELVEGRIDPEQASTELVRLPSALRLRRERSAERLRLEERLTTEVSRMSGRTGRNS